MMLHSVKNEDGIKNFFNEVYELYIKVCCLPTACRNISFLAQILLNPFYDVNSRVTSPIFQKRVESLGRKYLTS